MAGYDFKMEQCTVTTVTFPSEVYPTAEDQIKGTHPPMSEAAIRVFNSMLRPIDESKVLRDENDSI